MKENKNIFLLTGDLGYNLWDNIKIDFKDRFINAGSSEQLMMGMAIGLAMDGKIPIVYSITPFLLYRPFELIRNYVNHEKSLFIQRNILTKLIKNARITCIIQ